MKAKLIIEYDGLEFHGWQRQIDQRTVQEVLEEALGVYFRSHSRKLNIATESLVKVSASGRTDRGVHARGQVVSFSWPAWLQFDGGKLASSINGITFGACFVHHAELVDDAFDARHTRHEKCYRYNLCLHFDSGRLHRNRAWYVGPRLNIPNMIKAARLFCGTHDFRAFRASDCMAKTTERTINVSEFTRCNRDILAYTVCGNGFLKQMIRIAVGTLVEVGQGKRTVDSVAELLKGVDRKCAGQTAPPEGLVLEWVRY